MNYCDFALTRLLCASGEQISATLFGERVGQGDSNSTLDSSSRALNQIEMELVELAARSPRMYAPDEKVARTAGRWLRMIRIMQMDTGKSQIGAL